MSICNTSTRAEDLGEDLPAKTQASPAQIKLICSILNALKMLLMFLKTHFFTKMSLQKV